MTQYRAHILRFRRYKINTFLYATDRSSIQLIKLPDLAQGHLPSGLLSAGLAHRPCPCACGPAAHGPCPYACKPATSRLQCAVYSWRRRYALPFGAARTPAARWALGLRGFGSRAPAFLVAGIPVCSGHSSTSTLPPHLRAFQELLRWDKQWP